MPSASRMAEVRIATRRSALALAQARVVAEALRSLQVDTTLVPITTSGDLDRTSSVTQLTEVGAFVRAVQEAVLEGRADVAVHSAKDLPVARPEKLTLRYLPRGAPWDVLCGPLLGALQPGARVGTGSPRRRAQLLKLRPDLSVEEIRGNVDTRLRRLDAGEYAAVVLAEAGLSRLGLESRVGQRFSVEEMVPAAGQGAIALEALRGSLADELAASVEDEQTRRAVETERALLAATNAGCRSALGVHATPNGAGMRVHAFVADDHGPREATVEAADQLVVSLVREALSL